MPSSYTKRLGYTPTLSANTLFIQPSIDEVHMHVLLLLLKSCLTNQCIHCFKSHNEYWSDNKLSDVPPDATNVDV
jgi:hypothetical protein